MNVFVIAAALLAALLVLGAPAVGFKQHRHLIRESWRIPLRAALRGFALEDAGYTVTYCWPGGASGPSTTNPTATQASQVNLQTAVVAMGDTETFAYFTHNWGLPASFPTFLFPLIFSRVSDLGVGVNTFATALTFNITNTNVVIINKISSVGSGGSFIVTMMRPVTLIR